MWEKIKTFFINLWNKIKNIFQETQVNSKELATKIYTIVVDKNEQFKNYIAEKFPELADDINKCVEEHISDSQKFIEELSIKIDTYLKEQHLKVVNTSKSIKKILKEKVQDKIEEKTKEGLAKLEESIKSFWK